LSLRLQTNPSSALTCLTPGSFVSRQTLRNLNSAALQKQQW